MDLIIVASPCNKKASPPDNAAENSDGCSLWLIRASIDKRKWACKGNRSSPNVARRGNNWCVITDLSHWRSASPQRLPQCCHAPLHQVRSAHEIPSDVKINAFVKPLGDRLELLIRVPLAAMREVDFPTRGPGYLVISRADEALRNAAKLHLIDNITVYENDVLLPAPRILYARVSLPSDRSFTSYEAARAHVEAPRHPDDLELYWNQQLLDVLLEYPIQSDRSEFAIHPRVDRLGLQSLDGAALPAARRRHSRVRIPRRPRPRAPRSALASRRIALCRIRLLAHSRRHRPPPLPAAAS